MPVAVNVEQASIVNVSMNVRKERRDGGNSKSVDVRSRGGLYHKAK